MKRMGNNYRNGRAPAYPNGASRSYYLHKMLDIATAIISGMGLLAALVFLASIT